MIKPAAYYGNGGGCGGDSKDGSSSSKMEDTVDQDNISMGLKVVSVRANNPSKFGLPLVPATTILVNPQTGVVNATVSATHLTVARTSSGPALAVQTFQPYADHLVIFGAGSQAEYHIKLMQLAIYNKHQRLIPHITIINRTIENAMKLKENLQQGKENEDRDKDGQESNESGRGDLSLKQCTIDVVALDDTKSISNILPTADIIATTTNTSTPLWSEQGGKTIPLKKGCLITSVGSYTGDMAEIPQSVVNRSYVLVDTPEAVYVGDLKHLGMTPSQVVKNETETVVSTDNGLTQSHPVALFGMALSNPGLIATIPLPRSSKSLDSGVGATTDEEDDAVDYIFYKSVGTAIQDVLTADMVVEKAKSLGIGHEIDMT